MSTVKRSSGFAVWLTGLPASGKSTITSFLADKLRQRGVELEVLESDLMRRVLAPKPAYSDADREAFYDAMAWVGELLVRHGISVIFDATANRRAYRDRARERIAKFLEIYVECPLSVCMARDPKGIYRMGMEGKADSVPGLQSVYEPPVKPDLIVSGESDDPEEAAGRILEKIVERGYLAPKSGDE